MQLFRILLMSKPEKSFIRAFFYHDFTDVWKGAKIEDMPYIYGHELNVLLNNAINRSSYHQEHMRDYLLAQQLSVVEGGKRIQVILPESSYRVHFLDRVVFEAGEEKLLVSYDKFCRILVYYITLLEKKFAVNSIWKQNFLTDLEVLRASCKINPIGRWIKNARKTARCYLRLFVESYEGAESLELTDDEICSFNDLKCENTLINLSVKGKTGSKVTGEAHLKNFMKLETLRLIDIPLSGISFVQAMPNLRSLILVDNGITDLSPLAAHPSLKQLNLYSNPVKDITVIPQIPKLRHFFTDTGVIPNLEAAEILPTGLTISVFEITYVEGAEKPIMREAFSRNPLQYTVSKKSEYPKDPRRLDIRDRWLYSGIYRSLGFCPTVAYDMKKLKQLDCGNDCPLVEDYLFLTEMGDYSALLHAVNLKKLNLSGRILNDFSVLRNCTKLTHLNVSETNFEDISLLEYFPNLVELDLAGLPALCSLDSLRSLKKLRNLYIEDETARLYELEEALPHLKKHVYNEVAIFEAPPKDGKAKIEEKANSDDIAKLK